MEISPEESPANSYLPHRLPRPPQRNKKTRELPNLSNCHRCNRLVVNCNTNPKNRLKTLTSEWRIVLLCNSCYCLVESSQICSYCLTNFPSSSADSTFQCKRCSRVIHRKCVSMFGSGSGNGGDFSVCFDCWVPKLLENDYIRVCETRRRKKAKNEVKLCGDSTSLESSRVCNSQDKSKRLEKMVNVVAEKKVVVALVAKANAVANAMSARRVVEPAGDDSNFSAVDRGGSGNRGGLVVDDDAQLAFQLHRAINSSPRILRNSCLLNTNCVNLSMISGNANGQDLHLQEAEKTCLSNVVNVGSEANSSATDTLSCREQSRLCSSETKQGFVRKTDESEDEKSKLASNSNDCLITYTRKRKRQVSQDGRSKETNGLLRMYKRRLSHVERQNAKRDLSLQTYHRRLPTISHCKN